ncbi:hypothetical protein VPHK165_0027 [Vibrio phage K165]
MRFCVNSLALLRCLFYYSFTAQLFARRYIK